MPSIEIAAETRGARRTSLYLAAALDHGGKSLPVKIRNISASGALVEGAAVAAAARVELVRGRLRAKALVSWSGQGRCGLKFSGRIDVQQWRLASAGGGPRPAGEIVGEANPGAPSEPGHERMCEPGAEADRYLTRSANLLDRLSADLAGDPDVVERHLDSLQDFKVALQLIAAARASIARPV